MSPTTLADMLRTLKMDHIEERLQWMVLTWDLAATTGGQNKYYRYFLTTNSSLTTNGHRSPKVFSRENPLTGSVAAVTLDDNRALDNAIAHTNSKLSQGFSMVCRPLAVECFDFTHTAVIGGAPVRDAGQLLDQMHRKTEIGVDVLAYLNWARGEAIRTHLAPDWRENTGHFDETMLWSGR